MNYHWAVLDIAPTNDLKVIKRAYATQLKIHRPEDSAVQFQRLREAYEWACEIGLHQFHLYDNYEAEDAGENDYHGAVDDANDPVEFADVKLRSQQLSTDAELILAQTVPDLELILPSVPTHFPVTFEPPPSPSFPALLPNASALVDVPEVLALTVSPLLEVKVAAAPLAPAANIAYALNTEFSGCRLRSMAQFLAEFWLQSQQLKTILEIQVWLQAQAEYESLQMRPSLEDAIADAFVERLWPWPAVLAVANLLDWGTIGNLIGRELNQVVQLAQLQQRAAITKRPRWHQFLTKTAAAYFLLAPFSWPKSLFSALLPRTQQIDELCDEVDRAGVDPCQVFDLKQIEFQRKLRRIDFNLPRIAYALARFVGLPLLFSMLFIGVDVIAPLVGFAFGLACFAIWLGLVSNRLLFRRIWTPSPSARGAKAFWLGIFTILAVAGISEAFKWPNFAGLLAAFMLLAVAQNYATAFALGALGSIVAFLTAAVIWPMQAPEKFSFTAPITLSIIAMSVYFYQRRMPSEKLLSALMRAPVRPKPVAAANANFSWWWVIAGILLLRLLAAAH